MTTEIAPGTEGSRRPFGPLAFLGIAIGMALSIAKAMVWSDGILNAESLGYAAGAAAFPMLIAYAIAGRKKACNPNLLSLSFCAMCLVLLLLEIRSHPESWKDHARDIIKEAAGTKVPSSGETSANPEMDAIVRDITREMLEMRRAHDREVAKSNTVLDGLYSADSFSSPNAVHSTLDGVNRVLAADQLFSKQFAEWQERVELRVQRSSMSDQDKQDFLKGFRRSLGDSKILKVHQQIEETETRWAASTIDLYNFALSNGNNLTVKGSEIVISNESASKEFNRKMTNSQEIRKDLHELNAQLRELQKEGMQEVGVTPQDLQLK